MKLSVCIDSIFQGDPLAGLGELAALGYPAFEFWGWWNRDFDALKREKERLGLTVATFCTKMISLTEPGERDSYVEGLRESVAKAKLLGCDRLITQTGQDTGGDRRAQFESMAEGLRACAPLLEDAGITLLVEPLNQYDHPGYYLRRSDEAFDLIDAVGSPFVKVLFDIYHQQITEGDVLRRIRANTARIGHFHTAGNPGRHELDTGELHYGNILGAIAALPYDGYVGLEYFPLADPKEGLRKMTTMNSPAEDGGNPSIRIP